MAFVPGEWRLADCANAQQRQNHKDHGNGNEDKEQDLGNAGCACGYTGKAENTGHQGEMMAKIMAHLSIGTPLSEAMYQA